MDFRLNDEQRMWNDVVQNFMINEVGQDYTLKHDLAREFPEDVYRKMADLGWLGLLVPESQGGMETDPIMFAIFCEAIGKYSLDTAACIMTSMFTATNISRHGTPEQVETYIPPFLRGEAKFSISISEPQSGSDAAGGRSTARMEGDEWILNGNKVWCSFAKCHDRNFGANEPRSLWRFQPVSCAEHNKGPSYKKNGYPRSQKSWHDRVLHGRNAYSEERYSG